jgi:histidinol phosphatase-like PHP family hydrolase
LRAEQVVAGLEARVLTAIANPHTDVLGHCTGRLVIGRRQRNGTQKPRPESTFVAARRRSFRGPVGLRT